GSMTLTGHIDEAGIRIEPILLHHAGARNESLLKRLLSAVRTPQERLGDLDAQLAANLIGARAVLRVIQREGQDKVLQYADALLDYSQSFMTKLLFSMPVGQWTFEDYLDDDGVTTAPVKLHAIVTIENSMATIDLRNSADQVPGCINCPRAVALSAVYYCFAC